jgi:hypothetical protein
MINGFFVIRTDRQGSPGAGGGPVG